MGRPLTLQDIKYELFCSRLAKIANILNCSYLKNKVNDMWYCRTLDIIKRMQYIFLKYDLIITSRLHGHIFSCLLELPNYICDNSYGKKFLIIITNGLKILISQINMNCNKNLISLIVITLLNMGLTIVSSFLLAHLRRRERGEFQLFITSITYIATISVGGIGFYVYSLYAK